MSCCGNKKDVAPGTTGTTTRSANGLKAQKVFSNDNNPVTVPTTGYRPVPYNNVGNYKKVTKDENYWEENTKGSKSRLFTDETALNFNLEHESGVANTFDMPTFDYQTMLSHNIYFNLNSKGPLNVDDGNKSVLRNNSTSPTKVASK